MSQQDNDNFNLTAKQRKELFENQLKNKICQNSIGIKGYKKPTQSQSPAVTTTENNKPNAIEMDRNFKNDLMAKFKQNQNNNNNNNFDWGNIIPKNSLFFELPDHVEKGESEYKKIDLSSIRDRDPNKPPEKLNVTPFDVEKLKSVINAK